MKVSLKSLVGRVLRDCLRVGGILAIVGVVASLLMFHVWNQYQIMAIGYEIAEVTNTHRQLLEENKKLAIEAAVVGRTERMSEVARDRFGLEPAKPEQIRTISVDAAKGADVLSSNEHAVIR